MNNIIETERLLIVNAEHKDQKKIWKILTNLYNEKSLTYPVIEKFSLDWNIQKSLSQSKIDTYRNNNYFIWSIFLKESNKLIGEISLSKYDDIIMSNPDIVQLKIFIDKNHQNNGYASETLLYILDYIFNNTQIKEIRALVPETNEKFINILTSVGFKARYNNIHFKYCNITDELIKLILSIITTEDYKRFKNRCLKIK